MRPNKYTYICSVFLLVFSIVGCGSSFTTQPTDQPLKDLIRELKLYPYVLLESDEKLGNIITFGEEGKPHVPIADREECLPGLPDQNSADLSENNAASRLVVPSIEDNITSSVGLSGNLMNIFNGMVDVDKLSIGAESVKNVNIDFRGTTISRYTNFALVNELRKIEPESLCHELIFKKGNYIIFREAAAEGLSYTFSDSTGQNLNIDVTILEAAIINPEAHHTRAREATIETDYPLRFAYQMMDVDSAENGDIVFKKVFPEDLERILIGSRRQY